MKKNIFLLIILSALLCMFFVQESLAKYITTANEQANMSIARWKILVNNEDIRNQESVNAIITPTFPGNENIAENIIAPTSEGYFDLIIDGREADVSFKYKINISVSPDSSVKDLVATKYKINENPEIILDKANQSIENTILKQNNTNPITIRIYIKWDDAEGSTMNNMQDTEATSNVNPPKMDVKINFIQVV